MDGAIKEPHDLIEVYLSYKKLLIKLAQTYLQDPEQIYNLVADVAVTLLERRPVFVNQAACLAYMKIVVRNGALNYSRKKETIIPTEDPDLEAMQNKHAVEKNPYDRFEASAYLRTLMDEYGEDILNAFALHVIDDIPSNILAQQLGMNPDSLRRQFSRMKKKLESLAPSVKKEFMLLLIFMSH